MASTSLNISVVEKRLYSAKEAAAYCGLAIKHFKALCPVATVALRQGTDLYDKRDLDRWIDTVKSGSEDQSAASILDRL